MQIHLLPPSQINVGNLPATQNVGLVSDVAYTPIGGTKFKGTINNASTTILAPGSNANGIVLRNALANVGAGSLLLVADTSGPSSVADETKDAIAFFTGAYTQWFPGKLLIPAGKGLYAYGSTGGLKLWLSYDAL